MSNIIDFRQPDDRESKRCIGQRYRFELIEIAQFHHYLDYKLAEDGAVTQNSDDYADRVKHHSLIKLRHECRAVLSGRTNPAQLYHLLEKKDLYFQFGTESINRNNHS